MRLNLLNFHTRFPDEDACYAYIIERRWPQGVACINCGSISVYECKTRRLFKCKDCRKQFSPLVGTIFEATHIPLRAWFMGIFLMTTDYFPTTQLGKKIGITQKSAWYFTHRVLEAMKDNELVLEGEVQIDETYWGPKSRGRSSARYSKKYAIMGATESRPGGRSVFTVVKQPDTTVAMQFIHRYIAPGSAIFTDESRIYNWLHYQYKHDTVNHSQRQYVNGGVTTNLIENNWMHVKRNLKGRRIWVSGKHLSSYVAGDHQFKRNTRHLSDDERFEKLFSQAWGKRLTYKQLKAKKAVEPLALRGWARKRAAMPVQMSLF